MIRNNKIRVVDNRNLVYGGLLDKDSRNKSKKELEIKRRKRVKLMKIDVEKTTEEMIKIFE